MQEAYRKHMGKENIVFRAKRAAIFAFSGEGESREYNLPYVGAVRCCSENIKLIVSLEICGKIWIAIDIFKTSETKKLRRDTASVQWRNARWVGLVQELRAPDSWGATAFRPKS